jgi:MFS family permease
VLIPLGVGTVISLLGDATLYTVLPHASISAQAGVTLGMVGILLGANRATRLIVNTPVGLLYDRLPRRGLMVASLLVGALSGVLYATGSGFWPLLAGRVLWGIAWSVLWIGANAMVLDISTDEVRGRYSGQYQMWFFIGVATSSFLGGLFTDVLGFRAGLWLSSGLTGLAALMWFLYLPETRPAAADRNPSQPETRAGPAGSFPWQATLAACVPLFAMRFVFAGVLAATTILWLEGLLGGRGSFFDGLTLPLATLTGAFVAVQSTFSVLSAPTAGYLSDRLGRRWPVLALGVLLGAVGVALMSRKLLLPALAGALVAAVTGGSVESLIPALVGDRADAVQRGRALGMVYMAGDLGSTLGPLTALGLLNAGVMSLGDVYRGCALLFAAVAMFAGLQLFREPKRSRAGRVMAGTGPD